MKIKKYTANTEQEAIEKVKSELGADALVLSIKKTQPRGIFAFFRKPTVEVTAAYDEKSKTEHVKTDSKQIENNGNVNKQLYEQQAKISMLENEISNKDSLLEKAASLLTASSYKVKGVRRYSSNILQVFYETLIEYGVLNEIAEYILSDAESFSDIDNLDLEIIVKIVYDNILKILSSPLPVEFDKNDNCVFFLGPTGVGKTTTIAKLSSQFVLQDNLKLGLITADTYRIAAVEQLKTYAEILGVDLGIVYSADDLRQMLPSMRRVNDLVLIDTAGRSHKNKEAVDELIELLSVEPDSQKFLVLSLTTKYEDLINIVNLYSEITDFRIIFTKADETLFLGAILNICYLTNKKISYITNGQNVPDDIKIISPEQIAKSLLGLGGDI